MPKQFWSEYTQTAGVFSIGEVFNGNPKYVASYQGSLTATLNYPMYYKLLSAFQHKQSMQNIHSGVAQNSVFPDTSTLYIGELFGQSRQSSIFIQQWRYYHIEEQIGLCHLC